MTQKMADNIPTGNKAGPDSLDRLVAALPEIYQPIFGHRELSSKASRGCEDRFAFIVQIYQALENQLKRPLRVLDLGCAQGFFSLGLAGRGAEVAGIDFNEANIAVCNALAAEHPGFKTRFQTGFIEDAAMRLKQDEYDLVLGLSVFHHSVHGMGKDAVRKMLYLFAANIAAGIFEMALPSEPAAWAQAQPQNPRQLMEGYAFVHEFARVPTHLSSVARPFYFASNRYWFLNNHMEAFEASAAESHIFADNVSQGTRRYFFGKGLIAKLFYLDPGDCRAANLEEHKNEVALLQKPPAGLRLPRLVLEGKHGNEAWLVREYVPGELLIDRLRAGHTCNAPAIIKDILEQLTKLEAAGLYHNDVRIWNILMGADGRAALIDYGAVSKDKKDCAWPGNLFLAFSIFMHELISGQVMKTDLLRVPAFNPDTMPEPYRTVLWQLLELPPEDWSFAFLHERLSSAASGKALPKAARPGVAAAIQSLEEACKVYREALDIWRRIATHSTDLVQQLQNAKQKDKQES